MFWMGDAPTRPGINARFSIPDKLFFTLHKTNSCQFSPAPTSTSTKSFVSNILLIPNMLFFKINPSKFFENRIFEPPPRIRRLSFLYFSLSKISRREFSFLNSKNNFVLAEILNVL